MLILFFYYYFGERKCFASLNRPRLKNVRLYTHTHIIYYIYFSIKRVCPICIIIYILASVQCTIVHFVHIYVADNACMEGGGPDYIKLNRIYESRVLYTSYKTRWRRRLLMCTYTIRDTLLGAAAGRLGGGCKTAVRIK